MYCTNCGKELSDEIKFCPDCGTKVGAETPAPVPVKEPDVVKRGCLTVTRENGPASYGARVYIDRFEAGVLKRNQSLSKTIPVGVHFVQIYLQNRLVGETHVSVYEDDVTICPFSIVGVIQKAEFSPAYKQSFNYEPAPVVRNTTYGARCPRCGGIMTTQTLAESRKAGCGTILLYILLAITILGILVIIVLALRKKTQTTTYQVCQNCGYRKMIGKPT